jgi:hypothetical protein
MNEMTEFVLVRDRALLQSYTVRTRFKQKAAAVRQAEKLMAKGYGQIVVMAYSVYLAYGYDKLTRRVRNAMTGEYVDEPINTPYCCSVASDSYWCN